MPTSAEVIALLAQDQAFIDRFAAKAAHDALASMVAAHGSTLSGIPSTYATKAEVAVAERVLSKTITENYTLQTSDHGYTLECDSASEVVVTIPPDSESGTSEGHVTEIYKRGTGVVRVTNGAWVEILSENNMRKVGAQNASITIRHRKEANRWAAVGRLVA